jgi:hypothetical protein
VRHLLKGCGRGAMAGLWRVGFGWLRRVAGLMRGAVGAENLCDQLVFVEDAADAIVSADSEVVEVGDAVGRGRSGAACPRARWGRWVL